MARERVKDLKEVTDAANDMQAAIAGADEKFLNLLTSSNLLVDKLQQSKKYSKDNKEAAKQIAAAMSSVAAVAQKNTKENRAAVEEQRRLVASSTVLDDKQKKLLANQLKTTQATAQTADKANGLTAAIAASEKSLSKVAKVAGMFSAAFAVGLAIAKKVGEEIDEIGNTFGAIASDQAFQATFFQASVGATRLGLGIKDVLSVTDALTSKFGAEFGPEIASSTNAVLELARGTGLTTDEASNLVGVMTQVTGLTIDQAAELSQGVFNLAKQAQVAPVAVMKDLAGAGEAFANFSGGSVENLAKAAIQARALGISINDVAKAARGSLNFQESVRAELEFSVLSGRRINLQKARELALNKDLAGFTQEITRQLGSQSDFLSMNVFEQEAFAKATGFSVEQLSEMLDNSQKIESLSSRLASGPGFAELVGDESLSQITKFLNKLKEVSAEVIKNLRPGLESISERLNLFIERMGGAEGIALKIGGAFSLVLSAIELIANNLPTIIGMLAGFKAASVAIAIAQTIAAVAAASGATLGVGGIIVGSIITAAGVAAASYLASFHDLKPGTMAVATQPDSPVNMTRGEAVARVEDIGVRETHVHVDNQGVIDAINNIDFAVEIDRNKLQVLLNGGAGI